MQIKELVAQLVEQFPFKEHVVGSSPTKLISYHPLCAVERSTSVCYLCGCEGSKDRLVD